MVDLDLEILDTADDQEKSEDPAEDRRRLIIRLPGNTQNRSKERLLRMELR